MRDNFNAKIGTNKGKVLVSRAHTAHNLNMPPPQRVLNLKAGSTKVQYKLHPVVSFAILDHYKRRGPEQTRVIGTLLGEFNDTKTECVIKNCYPVPHLEGEDQV